MAHGSRLTAHGELAHSQDLAENSDFSSENSNLNSNSNSKSNSKFKKLSVIIPAYNVEKSLRKCVESVVNQTYKNIEIIIVDDGATDSTPQICDELEKEHENIIVIHQENQGLCRARGTGVHASTGDYIAFVDSDDYIDVTAYEKAMKVLEENDCDMVQFGYYEVLPDGKIISEVRRKIVTTNNSRDTFSYFFNLSDLSVWTKVYKRCLFDDIEWLKITTAEDYCISAQTYANVNKFMTMEDIFYYYVQNPESITHQKYVNKKRREDLIKAEDFVVDFTQKHFPEFLPWALWRKLICFPAIFMDYAFANSDDKQEVLNELHKDMCSTYERIQLELKKQNKTPSSRADFSVLGYSHSHIMKKKIQIWLFMYFPRIAGVCFKIRLKILKLTGIVK